MGIMLLLERSLNAQRQGAEQRRDASDKIQESREKCAVDKMRDEARSTFAGAFVSGMIQIGGGALQVIGVGLQAKSSDLAASAQKAQASAKDAASCVGGVATKATDLPSVAKQAAADAAQAALFGRLGEGFGKSQGIFSGLARGADGITQSTAKEYEADQATENHAAQAAGRASQRSDASATEFAELARKTLDRLEQLIQSEQQSRLAVLQRA